MSKVYNIVIAAGGTGGHVFPAIAIADAIRDARPVTQITFVGTKSKMEWVAVPKAGYPIRNIWISGFHRRISLQNLLFPIKLLVSIIQSFKILSDLKPHLFISCGGYVAGPTGWVAGKKGIPVIIQEQNSFPGVTNRMLAKWAVVIYTAFKQADAWLPKGRTMLIGNPTRRTLLESNRDQALEVLGFSSAYKTLLVLGGSGGAKSINEAMLQNLNTLHNDMNLQILWQCGTKYIDNLRRTIHVEDYDRLILTDFIDVMPAAYAAADLVVSRAGASSCAELMLTGKPSILIPSPHVAGDHQMMNARAMEESGAALVLPDAQCARELATVVSMVIDDQNRLQTMSEAIHKLAAPNAAADIAADMLKRLDLMNTP